MGKVSLSVFNKFIKNMNVLGARKEMRKLLTFSQIKKARKKTKKKVVFSYVLRNDLDKI
jgi:hypothetical protein